MQKQNDWRILGACFAIENVHAVYRRAFVVNLGNCFRGDYRVVGYAASLGRSGRDSDKKCDDANEMSFHDPGLSKWVQIEHLRLWKKEYHWPSSALG